MKVAFREKIHIIEYDWKGRAFPGGRKACSHLADALNRYGGSGSVCFKAPGGGGMTAQGAAAVYIARNSGRCERMNYTYLLRCCDGTLYCGWTNHLEERVAAHNSGKGAKYTRARRPVALAYFEEFSTKSEAMKREAAIKRLSRSQKEALVEEFNCKRGRREAVAMKMIVSPAKRMQVKCDDMPWRDAPVFLEEAGELLRTLQGFSEAELKALFKANDAITHENYLRYQTMRLDRGLTPAVLAYVGIQYQYMAPQIFTKEQWEYVCSHLRILSGLYGVLRADDGVVPYRLEMQAKLKMGLHKDLYSWWGDKLYRELSGGKPAVILNLASKEYSRAVEPYLMPEDQFVTCVFGTLTEGKVRVKATEAKMARGEMVRFLAERGAETPEEAKEFDRMGFSFCPERSSDHEFVFLKEDKTK